MNRATTYILLLIISITFLSCNKTKVIDTPQEENRAMSFNITRIDNGNTKAMINNINNLQEYCKTLDISTIDYKESIGIWADYSLQGIISKNVLNNTNIVYHNPNTGNTLNWIFKDDNGNKVDKYWVTGGNYKFRLFYPKNNLQNHISSISDATTFILDCNTELLQEDILVGYKEVNTADNNFNSSDAIDITLRHAMAAVKLVFKLTDNFDYEDYIVSAWFENLDVDITKGFNTVALLAYGDNTNPESIRWNYSYVPALNTPFHVWEARLNNNNEPIRDDGTIAEELKLTKNGPGVVPYTASFKENTGDLYKDNEGYFYVIPQVLHKRAGNHTPELANIIMKYKSTKGRDKIYRLDLPYKFIGEKHEFEAGKRYTINIYISETHAEAEITVSDWDKIDSNYDIDF